METIRPGVQPNLCLVRLHTDTGLSGLGEAFYSAAAVELYLHTEVAPLLLGAVNPAPEAIGRLLTPYVGYQGGGVEQRGNGAIDMALWDLLGHQAGLPLVRLLGGPARNEVRIYNTCAGPEYVSSTNRQNSTNWGLPADLRPAQYEDLQGFLTRPGKLARELADEGITGMKIWPFDIAAERTGGLDLSASELAAGVRIVEEIRSEVGWDMDLMIELHGLWNRRSATRIAEALSALRPYWIEDPLRPDAIDALAALRSDIDVPIATGETCCGRRGFLPLLQRDAVDFVTVDVGWTGGLTEAKKIADLADTFAVPVAPHDCTGPVSLALAAHLVCAQPNGVVQETTRAWLRTWYTEIA
ncbi:MAG: mandelate racemase/muconate lactonizing enzyme family protein, partial [Gammaproteobacteria bacterium]|nr:mandelate racemase/muconate lactonizing enzyme family protein [Gammaproteobacteria bacterium]